jgi:hypothetical protein
VISAGLAEDPQLEDQQRKLDLDDKLAHQSANGRQILAEKSDRWMPYGSPEVLIEAVRSVVAASVYSGR